MESTNATIEIDLKDFTEFREMQLFLDCLLEAGVEDWIGFSEAVKMFEKAMENA